MSELIKKTINWCSTNKKLFIFSFVCFLTFGFLNFPYDDLTGYVSDQVYTKSGQRVTLMASGLSLSLFPLGVKFTGQSNSPVTIDSLDFPRSMPPLELESLAVAPSISSLLQFKKGFFAQLNGLFGGEAKLKFNEGKQVSDQSELRELVLDLSASEISLTQMGSFFSFPVSLKGLAEMEMNAVIDPELKGQPTSEFDLEIEQFRLVGFNYLGMAVPTLDFKSARIKGTLTDGNLSLEEVQLGEKGDDMFGVIRGEIKIKLQKFGPNAIQPQFGAYRINVDLTTARKFATTLGLLDIVLPDIKKFKTAAPGGTRFNMALSANGFGAPPKLSRPRR